MAQPDGAHATRSSEQVRREIETERAQLAGDVQTLVGEADSLMSRIKAKAPLVGGIVVAAGAVFAVVRRRRSS